MKLFFKTKRIARYVAAAEAYLQDNYATHSVRYSTALRIDPLDQPETEHYSCEPSSVSRVLASVQSGASSEQAGRELDQLMNRSFVEKVSDIIAKKGLRDSAVYKAAQMDRRLFSKVMSDRTYKPAKDTAVAIAFALQLTLPQAEDLLSRAGYTLSHSIKRDVVIEYFFREGIYNLTDINLVLDKLELKKIGR